MKTLLAILLSFIVSEAPVFAIHGGYTLGGGGSVTGTYAGVLIPTSSEALTSGSDANSSFGTNSLGLFTLSVPASGVGTGTVVIFSGANQANGTIQALPDPNSDNGIVGVLTASALATDFSDNIGGAVVETVQQLVAQANGSLFASVANVSTSNSPTGVNLSGTSVVTFATTGTNGDFFFFGNNGLQPVQQVTFAVNGFQQSSEATQTSGSF